MKKKTPQKLLSMNTKSFIAFSHKQKVGYICSPNAWDEVNENATNLTACTACLVWNKPELQNEIISKNKLKIEKQNHNRLWYIEKLSHL